jgi:probable HAF family extracellular repeat protein
LKFVKIFRVVVLAVLVEVHVFAVFAQTHSCAAASHYKVIALPLQPARINDSGLIVGTTAPIDTASIDEAHKPAVWTEKDGLRVVELPAGFISAEPLGVNSAGDFVGTASREANKLLAFAYLDGKFSLLAEQRSKAMAINDSGDVAGQSGENLMVWRNQKAMPLGGCCGGIAHGINNRGQVVGQFNDNEGHYSAFVWDAAHGLQSIAPLKSASSMAVAINEKGHVLLKSFTPNAVFLRREGKLTKVELSPEFASQPLALNDCDVIVGEFGASSEWNHAFIWDEQHGFRNLNTLADVGAEWNLETALSINDRGEIVGIGDRGGTQDVGYLLVPQKGVTKKDTK